MSDLAELHILKNRVSILENDIGIIEHGLSKKERKLRDDFAQAALISTIMSGITHCSQAAEYCYEMADAMLVAREK